MPLTFTFFMERGPGFPLDPPNVIGCSDIDRHISIYRFFSRHIDTQPNILPLETFERGSKNVNYTHTKRISKRVISPPSPLPPPSEFSPHYHIILLILCLSSLPLLQNSLPPPL